MSEQVSLTKAAELVGMSKKELHQLVLDGDFIKPIPYLNPMKWYLDDVLKWVEENKKQG